MLRFTLVATAILSSCATQSSYDDLRTVLQSIIEEGANADNTSYAYAVAFGRASDDEIVHVYSGPNDRSIAGSTVNAFSLYPSGSVVKPWVTLIALRLSDPKMPVRPGGFLLDLDAPMLPIVDKWLKDQGLDTATEIWSRDPRVDAGNMTALRTVTTRMLLSMSGCLEDYDDDHMDYWTQANPNKDISPYTYITNVSHVLLCTPGEGAVYSGVSFVLAGMVLSASAGAKRWQDLDQMDLIQDLLQPDEADSFNRTIFMGAGKCSRWPNVVHQYGLRVTDDEQIGTDAGMRWFVEDTPSVRDESLRIQECDGRKTWPGLGIGTAVAEASLATESECCDFVTRKVKKSEWPLSWSWTPAKEVGHNGRCALFRGFERMEQDNCSTSGQVLPPPPKPSEFVDLYGSSCLNGWTMGNIATSPFDQARFYQMLMQGRLVRRELLEEMMHWHPLTNGWFRPGFTYGMGLMNLTSNIRLMNWSHADWAQVVGHAGRDWGSGMNNNGFYPLLNVSTALGTNSEMPMNFSTSERSNVACKLLRAVAQHINPDLGVLRC